MEGLRSPVFGQQAHTAPPAGRLLLTHPGRFLLFPHYPWRAPQGARGSVPVDEWPRAWHLRLEAWPQPQLESTASPGPVWAICVSDGERGNAGQARSLAEGAAAHVPGRRGAGRTHKHPEPAPRFPSSLLTQKLGCAPTSDVTLSPDTLQRFA